MPRAWLAARGERGRGGGEQGGEGSHAGIVLEPHPGEP